MHPRDLFTWEQIWHARYQIAGIALLGAGFAATIVLAATAASTTPPGVAESAVFVIVSGALNVGGVWLFSHRPGGANLTASRIALRHLADAGRAAVKARERAEDAFDNADGPVVRDALGHLSVQLSGIEQQLGSNIDDWVQSYPDLSPLGLVSPKTLSDVPESKVDHDK